MGGLYSSGYICINILYGKSGANKSINQNEKNSAAGMTNLNSSCTRLEIEM